MDKRLFSILIILVIGMAITVYAHEWPLFYVIVGGALVAIYLDTRRKRKKDQKRES
ncbi:MAG: hypothetical protein HY295_01270 [Thaumarchaeota archaeon]|nr:hypothetical protein [Nitrososphaerota archaeon]